MPRGRHVRSRTRHAQRVRSALAGLAVVAICAGAIIAVEVQHDAADRVASGTPASTTTRLTTKTSGTSTTVRRGTATSIPSTTNSSDQASTTAVTTSVLGSTGSARSSDLAGKVVVIDPGHNGGNGSHPDVINQQVQAGGFTKSCDTTGTETDDGYPEHAFTWDVSVRLQAILRSEGAKVVLTHPDDQGVGPCVNERAAIGNENHADAAISTHADGGPATGRGFHVLPPAGCSGCENSIDATSLTFATDLRDVFRAETSMPVSDYLGSNGIYPRTDLGGLNLSTVPKVFIECGNMRNATDASMLKDPSFRQTAAQAIADGIAEYLSK